MEKHLVLFSGGPDSLAAFCKAKSCSTEFPLCIYIHYGQVYSQLNYARLLMPNLQVVSIQKPWVNPTERVDRNLLFLTYASIRLKELLIKESPNSVGYLWAGFCEGELGRGSFVYDVSPSFVDAYNKLHLVDTRTPIRLRAPYASSSKKGVIQDLLYKYYAPIELTWSCWRDQPLLNGVSAENSERLVGHCGTCRGCKKRIEAFSLVGVEDPIYYEFPPSWDVGIRSWEDYKEERKLFWKEKEKGFSDVYYH